MKETCAMREYFENECLKMFPLLHGFVAKSKHHIHNNSHLKGLTIFSSDTLQAEFEPVCLNIRKRQSQWVTVVGWELAHLLQISS